MAQRAWKYKRDGIVIERASIQRNALLLSAREQYQKFGYQQMTVERALTRAGLSKSLFYKFFKSKSDFVEGVLLNEAIQLSIRIKHAMSEVHDKCLQTTYIAVLEAYFSWCTQNRAFCIKFVRDLSNQNSPIPKVRGYCVKLIHGYWTNMSRELGLPATTLIQTDSFIHLIERYMNIFLEQVEHYDALVVQDYIDRLLKITIPIVEYYEKNALKVTS
jgi:AcrR family transcriptional regulator